jgi:hypothetical protein
VRTCRAERTLRKISSNLRPLKLERRRARKPSARAEITIPPACFAPAQSTADGRPKARREPIFLKGRRCTT